MVVAGEIIYKLSKIPVNNNLKNNVITVGRIIAGSNNSNVIAVNVEFFIDVRDVDHDDQIISLNKIEELYEEIINKHKI